jgi:hypothetical protein
MPGRAETPPTIPIRSPDGGEDERHEHLEDYVERHGSLSSSARISHIVKDGVLTFVLRP